MLIETHRLVPGVVTLQDDEVYNALDACVTFEVNEELRRLSNDSLVYDFERAMQAPALEMNLRGFKIDEYERQRGIDSLSRELGQLDEILQEFAHAVWSKALNARSSKQLLSFFNGAMRMPETYISQKGIRRLSANREVLEKWEVYLHARPIIATILAYRDVAKRLEVLQTEVDSDGRIRTSYNIAGTETGRWSSSASATGGGGNLQNITPPLRRMFVADAGWKLCGIDLEQAESREVGWLLGTLFDDWRYLDACEGGDLHTAVARLIWPHIASRAEAEEPFYRHFSYRDMSKRGGHLSNYMGTAWTASRHLKVPVGLMEDFQQKYCLGADSAFPAIPKWWRHVAAELQTTQRLTTPWGRTRQFFGRPNDDATLREAIAFGPQSATGDRLNLALWRIWKHMGTRVQILAQVHDALYFQYREDDDEDEVLRLALGYISTPVLAPNGRIFDVPGEAKVGWNWAGQSPANPDGLVKWKGVDSRRRSVTNGLDRRL